MTSDFIGRGWAFPLEARDDGAIATVDGVANLEKAMAIVLRTHLGERPMRPAFGSRLRDFLFEGISPDNLTALGQEVDRALTSCEPRVRVDDVTVRVADAGRGKVDIAISYTVLSTNSARNLVMPFYSIPGEEEA